MGGAEKETRLLSHQQAETTCWNSRHNCTLSARWNNNCGSFKSVISSLLVLPRIREAAKTHKLVEQELAHAVNATALVLTEAKLSSPEVRQRDGQADGQMVDFIDETEELSIQTFSNTLGSRVRLKRVNLKMHRWRSFEDTAGVPLRYNGSVLNIKEIMK